MLKKVIKIFITIASFQIAAQDNISLKIESDAEKTTLTCSRGETRELTDAEKDLQEKYKIKMQCPFYKCNDLSSNEYLFMDYEKNPLPILVKLNKNGSFSFVNNSKIEGSTKTNGKMSNYFWYSSSLSLQNDSKLCVGEISKTLSMQFENKNNSLLDFSATNLIQGLIYINNNNNNNNRVSSLLFSQDETVLCNYNETKIQSKDSAQIISMIKDQKFYSGPKRPISLEAAELLFNNIATNEEIPWTWSDGCFARAEVVADILKQKDVESDKIWVSGKIKNPNTGDDWNFHVANIVYVNDGNNVEKYVLDPAVAKRPLKIIEWLSAMRKKDSSYATEINFPIPVNNIPDDLTVFALSDSIHYSNGVGISANAENHLNIAKSILHTAKEKIDRGESPSLFTPIKW